MAAARTCRESAGQDGDVAEHRLERLVEDVCVRKGRGEPCYIESSLADRAESRTRHLVLEILGGDTAKIPQNQFRGSESLLRIATYIGLILNVSQRLVSIDVESGETSTQENVQVAEVFALEGDDLAARSSNIRVELYAPKETAASVTRTRSK